MISGLEKESCTGCGVCATVCPKNCIEMQPDETGFAYPDVNSEICVNCEICNKKCHAQHIEENDSPIPEVYVGYCEDREIRKSSSSGGVFTLIAQTVLSAGGVVYGVKADENNKIVHFRTENASGVEKMRGSKYVQSAVSPDIYKSVQKDLQTGNPVIYSGTPCQIGALNAFLGKKYSNLITVSFICHGVPSPKVWGKYLTFQENKYCSKAREVSFRNKDRGWANFSMKILFDNGKTYRKTLKTDPYLRVFLKNLCLRPVCYQCRYKGNDVLSSNIDILLADKWGNIGTDIDRQNDDKGISLIFLQSSKAKEMFDKIKNSMSFRKADYQTAVNYNSSYNVSASRSTEEPNFYKDLNSLSFELLYKKYAKIPLGPRVKDFAVRNGFKICKKLGINKTVKKLLKR